MTESATLEAPAQTVTELAVPEVKPEAMEFLSGFDAAYCPNPVPTPAEYEVVSFYIGGSSAYHVWTAGERALIKGRITLPIWVPSPNFDNPTQAAKGVAATMHALGIPSGATPYRAVMWDMETSENSEWMTLAADKLASLGYDSLVYGSEGSVFELPARSGYIVANPTGEPHMFDYPGVVGTQYAWGVQVTGGQVDADLYLSTLRPHLTVLA
jgi:hypothetical protein